MQELEHPIAIYCDDAGVCHEIRAGELNDPKTLEKERDLDLFDEFEQVRL